MHISGNSYSLIVNDQRYDFFKSKNKLRQEDRISPSLFVSSPKLLSTMLNELQNWRNFSNIFMNKLCSQVTHLAFADDLILFSSDKKSTLK